MEIKKPGICKMNLDVTSTLLKESEVRRVINGHTFASNDGKDGTVRNVKGTLRIPFSNSFSFNAKTVGATRNDNDNSLIFFVADPDGPSFIMRYNEDGTVDKVAEEVAGLLDLDFNINRPVEAFVINGLLYFNDGETPPKKLNIEKAVNRYSGNTPAYKTLDNQTISLIKKPPMFNLYPLYFTNEEKSINRLRGKMFQFRAVYKYDDNELSTSGPISKAPLPVGETDYDGEIIGITTMNNGIKVSINSGHHTVKAILIYVREGNVGDWALADTIDKEKESYDDNKTYEYEFYNSKTTIGIDQSVINRTYSAVPLKADSIGYVHTNNIILGGLTEGYENITPDVTLTPVLHDVTSLTADTEIDDWDTEPLNIELGPGYSPGESIWAVGLLIKSLDRAPAVNSIIVINDDIDFIVTNAMANDTDTFREAIVDIINQNTEYTAVLEITGASGESFSEKDVFVYEKEENQNPTYPAPSITIKEYNTVEGVFKSYPGWRSGSEQQLGIEYFDEYGRSSFVQKLPPVYLPFLTEDSAVFPATDTESEKKQNLVYSIDWKINHAPPSWAKYYCFVRQQTPSISDFRRYIIAGVKHGLSEEEGESAPDADKSTIDITPLNMHSQQNNNLDFSFPNSSITGWTWQKGDRVRFITQKVEEFGPGEKGLGPILDTYLDMEIMGYRVNINTEDGSDEVTNELIVQLFNDPEYENIGENTLIEIYRPKLEQEDAIYYECGPLMNIISDPNVAGGGLLVHAGTSVNQSYVSVDNPTGEAKSNDTVPGLPAKGSLVDGDIYVTPTLFSKNLANSTANKAIEMVEGLSYSNYYSMLSYDLGRPNIVNEEATQEKQLVIRQSERYYEGTEVNGLSTFVGGSDLQLSSEFGNTIHKLVEVGFTLKAFQAKKITSFFVGRTGLQLATGQEQDELLAGSNEGIDTKSPAAEFYGTTSKESVIAVERNVYFVDTNRAAIVRIAPNGMFDITNYGIKSEIYEIITKLKTDYVSYRVIGNYNPITNNIGFTFLGTTKKGTVENLGTYYFSAEGDAWTTIWYYQDQYAIPPELFANLNQAYFSFLNGQMYRHEVSDKMNFFYDNVLETIVEMEFNERSSVLKMYSILEYEGSGDWHCSEYKDIQIDPEFSVSGLRQDSLLPLSMFRPIKSKHNARFLRDGNYKQGLPIQYNLLNGDNLRGRIIKVKIRNKDTKSAYLDTVAVKYQPLPSI